VRLGAQQAARLGPERRARYTPPTGSSQQVAQGEHVDGQLQALSLPSWAALSAFLEYL